MKRLALSLVSFAALIMLSTTASAADAYFRVGGYYPSPYRMFYGGPGYVARTNHALHHGDLEHRAFHRELDHRAAHRYPMTYWQHEALHDDLDHEAFHDGLEHHRAHATGAYYPRGFSYYSRPAPYYRSGFSLYIGR
jgi:hypothetical protein